MPSNFAIAVTFAGPHQCFEDTENMETPRFRKLAEIVLGCLLAVLVLEFAVAVIEIIALILSKTDGRTLQGIQNMALGFLVIGLAFMVGAVFVQSLTVG